jgi:CMP-N-acetylneuraminic acid synthetase
MENDVSIDIDEKLDFIIANELMKSKADND